MVYNGIPRFTSLHQLKRLKRTEHNTKYHFKWSIPNRHDLLLAVVPPATVYRPPPHIQLFAVTSPHRNGNPITLSQTTDRLATACRWEWVHEFRLPIALKRPYLDLFPCCVEVETIRLGTCYHLSLWPRNGKHAQTYGSRDGKENVDFGSFFDLGSG